MKKYLILAIGVVLVSVFGYYGWKWNLLQTTRPPVVSSTPDGINKNFQIAGTLIRNSTGLVRDIWYLTVDMPDKPASRIELKFVDTSECSVGSTRVDCNKIDFPNGTRVRVSGEKENEVLTITELTAETSADLISVDKITSGDILESPTTITGRARGQWFFEASFPIRLIDLKGTVITTTIAQAGSDWMTTDFVPFSATINFDVATKTPAELVLAADNPSGLPQNDREIKIPVTLLPSKLSREVNLYYYNAGLDKDGTGNILCSEKGLVSVKRFVPNSDKIISDTVNLLLAGNIYPAEKAQGVSSEFPIKGVKLNSLFVNDGIATLNFSDLNNKTSGGSCRVGVLWMQIEATVKQFPGIKEVKFFPETLFQP
ncbi:MAG: GerMN domain-containing protein [Patescibacteria group bacterium]|jgi:hypothetical protein